MNKFLKYVNPELRKTLAQVLISPGKLRKTCLVYNSLLDHADLSSEVFVRDIVSKGGPVDLKNADIYKGVFFTPQGYLGFCDTQVFHVSYKEFRVLKVDWHLVEITLGELFSTWSRVDRCGPCMAKIFEYATFNSATKT